VETGGRKPKGGSKGKLDGRTEGAGRKPGTGGPEPEGESGRAGREAKASRTVWKAPEGWNAKAQAGATIRERETRQVEGKRKPNFNDNGDAEAGLRGRHQSGARRKPNAGRSRREGGSRRAQARRGSRARWSTGRRELAAARGEGRKAGAVCGGTSLRPIAGGLGKGAQALETSARASRSSGRKPVATEGQRHARGPLQNEGAKARANTPERGRPEGWPEGMAGDEGREPGVECRSRKAAGGLSGSEGASWSRPQPESEARGRSPRGLD